MNGSIHTVNNQREAESGLIISAYILFIFVVIRLSAIVMCWISQRVIYVDDELRQFHTLSGDAKE